MFMVPVEYTSHVVPAERFTVAKIGHGKASLCGNKLTLIISSEGRKLGERFRALDVNQLIPEEEFFQMKDAAEEAVAKRPDIVPLNKLINLPKRTIKKR